MNDATIDRLLAINTHFYAQQARSFSQTREEAWPGWQRCVPLIQCAAQHIPERTQPCCRILDAACGNLRFETFLQKAVPEIDLSVCGVDNCPDLMHSRACSLPVELHERDIVAALRSDTSLFHECLNAFDVSVCFGFMHHIPSTTLRLHLIRMLADATRPDGFVICSFWKFMDDPHLATKAHEAHDQALQELGFTNAELETGDFLIGWQNKAGVYRYCHSFTAEEIDRLVDTLCATPYAEDDANYPVDPTAKTTGTNAYTLKLKERFCADGRNASLNEYVVFHKTAI